MHIGLIGFLALACLPEAERYDTGAPESPPTARDPEGHLSAALSHTCALSGEGAATCWGTTEGDWNYGQVNNTPDGTFVQIGAGGYFSCALEDEGALHCWGQELDIEDAPSLRALNVGVDHICGLDADGLAYCTGDNSHGQIVAPEGSFEQISAGYGHSCALKANGKAVCWGNDQKGQASPPDVTFDQLSAGAFQTCGIESSGGVVHCWGEMVAPPPLGNFRVVSASRVGTHACGITDSGEGKCWGFDDFGQAPSSIEGIVTHVSAGGTHTCVTTQGGNWTCFGQDTYGEATPPG